MVGGFREVYRDQAGKKRGRKEGAGVDYRRVLLEEGGESLEKGEKSGDPLVIREGVELPYLSRGKWGSPGGNGPSAPASKREQGRRRRPATIKS